MAEFTQNVVVEDAVGVHARVAAAMVMAANRFSAEIRVRLNGREVNGRSMIELLCLGVSSGTQLTVIGKGNDASGAVRAVAAVLGPTVGEYGRPRLSSSRVAASVGIDATLHAA